MTDQTTTPDLDVSARPWHAVLLDYLEEARAKAARSAPLCRGEEVRWVNEGMAAAHRDDIAHLVAVCYGPDAVADYLRDGTLPETAVGDYEAVLTAELTRLARTMIDPGTGSDVGDQVAVVMGLRDARMRQMEEELVEDTGVMQALRRQRDEAETAVSRVRDWLSEWGPRLPDGACHTLAAALAPVAGRPAERDHIGGNAEECPGCDGTNPPYPFICPGPGESAA